MAAPAVAGEPPENSRFAANHELRIDGLVRQGSLLVRVVDGPYVALSLRLCRRISGLV
jgi:hypothetical protein